MTTETASALCSSFPNLSGKVMYTSNSMESLKRLPPLNRGRTVSPNAMTLTKALYLASWELTKKRTLPVRNWGKIYAELAIMYPGRLSGD